MREIEFRGKDKYTGKWVYGDLTHTMGVTDTGLRPRVMVGGYEVYEDSVGQYIGLRDKYGKKIYDGDIVKTKYGRLCRVFYFYSPSHICIDLKPMEFGNKAPDECDVFESRNLEIIGNEKDSLK